MKKINLGLVALSALSLVGCGGNNSNNTGDIAITWWNNYKVASKEELEAAGTDEAKLAALKLKYAEHYYAEAAIEAFHKAHPNITVTQAYKGSYNDIANEVSSNIGSGNTPNIVSAYQDNAFAFNISDNAVLDMTEYAKELERDADFNQAQLAIEKKIYNGKLLSLPYSKSAEMLVVNKSAFELVGAGKAGVDADTGNQHYAAPEAVATKTAYTIPTTWDEMISTARKIKADFPTVFENQIDKDGFFTALPICWDSTENMAITFLENAGITYTDGSKTGAASVPVFDNADAKALFVQLKKWNQEGLLGTQNQLPMSGKYHIYGSEMFYTGKSFMNISSTAGSTYFAADGFRADIAVTPSYNNNSKVISQGPSLVFLKKKDNAVNDAAFEFYKFLTSKDWGSKLTAIDAYFPLRTSTYNEASVKEFTDKATATLPADTEANTRSAKMTTYVGQALNLNKTYTEKNSYYISDVFEYSAKFRTAIGKLVTSLFNDRELDTDAKIAAKVDELFEAAKTETFTK